MLGDELSVVIDELWVVVAVCVELVDWLETVVGVAEACGLRNEAFKPASSLNFAGTKSLRRH